MGKGVSLLPASRVTAEMAPLEKHRSALPAVTHSLSAKSPGGRSEEPAALMEMNLFSPSHTQIQATDKRSHAGS